MKHRPFIGQRVTLIDNPTRRGTIRSVRKAARRSFWNVQVSIHHEGDQDHGLTLDSISTCWQ